jgi:FdhD protein
LDEYVIVVSGRVSFEIAQKALAARVPILAAVSAPSSLAVHLAEESGLTLVSFLRDGRFNMHGRCERIEHGSAR